MFRSSKWSLQVIYHPQSSNMEKVLYISTVHSERLLLCDVSTVHLHYIKGKVTSVHAMKAYMRSKSTASLTLNHCSGWR